MKVPKSEAVVTLGRSKPSFAGSPDLEKDLAIEKQGEKLDPRKTFLLTQLFDLPRGGEHGDGRRSLRIANFEQRAGARRLQHHLGAAPSHEREPRQDESLGIAELRRLRPIIGNLRLDDPEVLAVARAPEAVLQETMPSQSPDQESNLFVDIPANGRNRAERQPYAQFLRAIRRGRAERSQAD